MLINGMSWCSVYSDWGVKWAQVEFLDGVHKRFIAVSEFDSEWSIVLSDESMIDMIMQEEFEPEKHEEVIRGEFPEILPQIVKSPYSADICFAMKCLRHFPGLQSKKQWQNASEKYIRPFIGKESGNVI